jgi:hypothetical protein
MQSQAPLLALAEAAPGVYFADFGGVSVNIDLNERLAEVFTSPDATDADIDAADMVLSRLGIASLEATGWIEGGLFVMTANF